MAMGHTHAQPLAARRPPVPARHVGGGPSLVDKDEALRVEIELSLEPVLAPLHDVRSILLAGVRGLFFARDLVAIEKPPERSIAHQDPFLGELLAEFLERQVWRGLKRREDCRRVRFRPVRAVVAANRLWRGVPFRSKRGPSLWGERTKRQSVASA